MESNTLSNQSSNCRLSRGQVRIDSVQSGRVRVDKAVEALCKACVTELWDESVQSWVDNKCKCGGNGLYIEANKYLLRDVYEIPSRFVEFISKVPRHKIMAEQYDSIEEKARVDKAMQLCNDSIFFANDYNLTLATVENTIKNAKENYDIQYIAIGDVCMETLTSNPTVNVISYLKKFAKQYDIGIYSMIQNPNVLRALIKGIDSES
jgi:hypothetical protein